MVPPEEAPTSAGRIHIAVRSGRPRAPGRLAVPGERVDPLRRSDSRERLQSILLLGARVRCCLFKVQADTNTAAIRQLDSSLFKLSFDLLDADWVGIGLATLERTGSGRAAAKILGRSSEWAYERCFELDIPRKNW